MPRSFFGDQHLDVQVTFFRVVFDTPGNDFCIDA